MIDLHLHTAHSDGQHSTKEVLTKLVEKNITHFSITDHDCVNDFLEIQSSDELKTMILNNNLRYYSGAEFTCDHKGKKMHILGYGIDAQNEKIAQIIEESKFKSKHKLESLLQHLETNFDIRLPQDAILRLQKKEIVKRPHIAHELVLLGYEKDVTSAVRKYLKTKLGNRVDASIVIDAITSAGGIAVWAHSLGGVDEPREPIESVKTHLPQLIEYGLNGLECYYSLYNRHERTALVDLASEHNLIISGGSDFHGKTIKPVKIGDLSSDNSHENAQITLLKVIKPISL